MESGPKWLPAPLCYADYDGDWNRFLAVVYSVFYRDFRQSKPLYEGHPLVYDGTFEAGKERIFWHLTSSCDRQSHERLPDLRRCECIPWPRPTVENSNDSYVSVWRNKRGRETRVMLWLEAFDYLVVLAEKRNVFLLITGYCTDREHTREKLRKERKQCS